MNLRAEPESKFLFKYLIIGVGCIGFAIYCFYDGFFAYPARIPRAEAWAKLEAQVESDPELDRAYLNDHWKVIAKENGWSSKQLTKDDTVEEIHNLIIYQYVFIVIGLAIGVPCLIWFFRNRNTWIESTENSVRSSDGREVKLDQIREFDKKKWEKKGIGVLKYETESGNMEKFVLDDLKYNRKTTDEIVRWIESNIASELIVNGDPEPTAKPKEETAGDELESQPADDT